MHCVQQHRTVARNRLRSAEQRHGFPMDSQWIPANEENDEQPSDATLDNLLFELLDIILENSLLHWILNNSPNHSNEEAISYLASVSLCWFLRMTRRRFKKRVWHSFKYFYGKRKKLPAIIRNNRNYLLENIQPCNELIRQLLYFKCITKEQSHVILQHRSKRNKNDKLLYFVRFFDQTKSSSFVKCLRHTNQMMIASLIENGGVVIIVDVRIRGVKDALLDTQLSLDRIHKKIENLRNRTIPRLHENVEHISKLKDKGIEILNSQLDRQTVVVWIWCRSRTAHETIQTLYYESNKQLLADVLFDFENIRPCVPELSIDKNHFKKAAVVISLAVNFTGKLDVQTGEATREFNKLRDEIYILCQSYSNAIDKSTIRVFEDRYPFRFQRAIELKDMVSDMVSSEKNNCLYVISDDGESVRKISRKIDNQYKIIKWLTTDDPFYKLSVSSCGQLLVILRSTSISIYGSDAELIRSIQLPKGIRLPRHVVETSFRNFIILHKWSGEKKADPTSLELEGEWIVSEMSRDGQTVIRRFLPSNGTQKLIFPDFFLLDSDDRVFIADGRNNRVVLLDPDLEWNRAYNQLTSLILYPYRLWYDEGKKQLIVSDSNYDEGIAVYTLCRK